MSGLVMPIENTINDDEKVIYSTCVGVMAPEDFDDYVHRIWNTADHFGYNEFFDVTQGDWSTFDFGYLLTVAQNAAKLFTIDPNSKLAWLVLEGKQKELTDFYKAAKLMTNAASRELEAFYSKEEALKWLNTP